MAGAYLQVTLNIRPEDRDAAAEVYQKYREPFLNTVSGAVSKELLVREEDVQVLHGFQHADQAREYLAGDLFAKDVTKALQPLLVMNPEIRIYTCA